MKKLATLLTIMLMTVVTAGAKSDWDDISSFRDMENVSYIQAEGGLLKSGLFLSQYGILPGVTENLQKLQIVVIPSGSPDLEKCRQLVRKVVKGMERPLDMSTSRSNIVVWGNANKHDVYEKVVIGIGSPGQLTYVFMEGEVTGSTLGTFLSTW